MAAKFLFNPSKLHVSVADDCQIDSAVFTATKVGGDSYRSVFSDVLFLDSLLPPTPRKKLKTSSVQGGGYETIRVHRSYVLRVCGCASSLLSPQKARNLIITHTIGVWFGKKIARSLIWRPDVEAVERSRVKRKTTNLSLEEEENSTRHGDA